MSYSANAVARTHLASFRPQSSQGSLYFGCKQTNIYSRAINKTSWSSIVFNKVSGAGNLRDGYTFTVPNDKNSNLAYLLKAVLNVTLPSLTLSNVNSSYPATTTVAGSYDITFPIPNAGAAAATNALPGADIAVPNINDFSFTSTSGVTYQQGTAIVGYPLAVVAGDLMTFRFCYSDHAPIYSVTYDAHACNTRCGDNKLFVIYPDVCIVPIFPVPAAPIISYAGPTLYPGYPSTSVASTTGLVVPVTDPLTGIPLPGAGFGSITNILSSLPGGGGTVLAGAATALCPPVANGPACCSSPSASTVSTCSASVATLSPGVTYYSIAGGATTVGGIGTPVTSTPSAPIAPPYASLPLGAGGFMGSTGYTTLTPNGVDPAAVLPKANYTASDLIAAIAAIGAPNSFCECSVTTAGIAGGCGSQGGCRSSNTYTSGPIPGCLTNVPATVPGSTFPSVSCVNPIILHYPRNRVAWSPGVLLEMLRSVTFTSGCFTDTLTPTALSAYANYIMNNPDAREAFYQSFGNLEDFTRARISHEGGREPNFIPERTFSIVLPNGFARDTATAFPLFLAKGNTSNFYVQLNAPFSDYMIYEREIIRPAIVPPNSIGFSPVFAGSVLNGGVPLPAGPNGMVGYTPYGATVAVSPLGLALQCTPLGLPGTGHRTDEYVRVRNHIDDPSYRDQNRGVPLISLRDPLDELQWIHHGSRYGECFPTPSLTLFMASVTSQQIEKTSPANTGIPKPYLVDRFVHIGSKIVEAGEKVEFNLSRVSGETKAVFVRATNLGSMDVGIHDNGTTNAFDPYDACSLPIVRGIEASNWFDFQNWEFFNRATAVLTNAALPSQTNIALLPLSPDLLSVNPKTSKSLCSIPSASLTVYTNHAAPFVPNYVLSAPITITGCGGEQRCIVVPIQVKDLSKCSGCPTIYIPPSYLGLQCNSQGTIVITPSSCGVNGSTQIQAPNASLDRNVAEPCRREPGCGDNCVPELVTNPCGNLILTPGCNLSNRYKIDLVAWQWALYSFDCNGEISCADDSLKCLEEECADVRLQAAPLPQAAPQPQQQQQYPRPYYPPPFPAPCNSGCGAR